MEQSPNGKAIPYHTGWIANGLSWSFRDNTPFRFAVGSFTQEYKNNIDIVQMHGEDLVCRATFTHTYPPTKIMFSPEKSTSGSDLLITTGDYLRVWEIKDAPEGGEGMKEKDVPENQEASNEATKQREGTGNNPTSHVYSELLAKKNKTINSKVVPKKVFDFVKPNDFCSPVTSCDWNADNPSIVGCSSIDTTVTIWNIAEEKHTMQLIAHDKEVYDIAFAKGTHTFASCGADGSVRIFDLREMEHCTIVYETPQLSPLLRVAWNKDEETYLSTFGINSTEVIVIDIRYPAAPVGTLKYGHQDAINSICWAPHSSRHMCSAGEDGIANIWNLTDLPQEHRYLTYEAPGPINTICWSAQHEEYIGITAGKQAQVLRI
eukprot:Tbor_TRINITY_DN5530_c0_g1::TRINITY_DN5530_c0_g1_i1::g.13186::m.13186/K11805/WDR68, HAN11; WD repeat-containing protein 68